jgi:predicted nucleotidyltransferase
MAGMSQADLAHRAGTRQSAISAYETGRRDPTVKTFERILIAAGCDVTVKISPRTDATPSPQDSTVARSVAAHREEIHSIIRTHGGRRVHLFGSVARGDDNAESDVDLLVDLPEGTGILTIGSIARDVERLLGIKVDVVPESALGAAKRQAILAEAVEL